MKTNFLVLVSFVLGVSNLARADDIDPTMSPVIVNASIKSVFLPNGFDDNDNVEVVVHGHLKNSCYRVGSIYGVVDTEAKTIQVHAKAIKYPADDCVAMALPYTQAVKLGTLPAGVYTVSTSDSSLVPPQAFAITHSPSASPDDFLYAPVDLVDLESTPGVVTNVSLTIKGVFPKLAEGCMVLKEVKTFLSPKNVLIVLPIAEVVFDARCGSVNAPASRKFTSTQALQYDFDSEVLVHVRVLNGQSLNRVIELD